MIRLTIELVPKGIENQKRTLVVAEISNVAETQEGLADYSVKAAGGEETFAKIPPFTVCRWKRSLGLLPLMIRIMETMERYAKLA